MIEHIINWKRVNDRDRNFLVGFWCCWTRSLFGGCLRSLFSDWFNHAKAYLPYGTLAANLLGSLLIGIFAALVAKGELSQMANTLLAGGFCGGLTTFSTFSLENLKYFKQGKTGHAVLYWCGSVVLCLACVYLGLALGKLF